MALASPLITIHENTTYIVIVVMVTDTFMYLVSIKKNKKNSCRVVAIKRKWGKGSIIIYMVRG